VLPGDRGRGGAHHGAVSSGPPPLPDEPPDDPLASVRVPDDARDLAFEAEALRRERAAQRRRQRVARRLRTRRWERFGLSGALVAAVLAVVALVGSLMVLLGPRPQGRLTQQPLADVAVGGEGGLVPDVPLAVGAGEVSARVLRPGVLALVPDGCDCALEAEQVIGQAASVRLPTSLVAAPESVDDVAALRDSRRVRPQQVALDRQGALADAYDADASGLTLLLVQADGVVTDVVPGFMEGQRLEPRLVDLARASGLE
jgi:hypothetical protein